jgi:hypothetical protein
MERPVLTVLQSDTQLGTHVEIRDVASSDSSEPLTDGAFACVRSLRDPAGQC